MATKKVQSKAAAPASNNNDMWKWVYVIGILAASVAGGLGFTGEEFYLPVIFAVVGLLAGLFYFNSEEVMNFGLRYLIVSAAAGSLSVLPFVGTFITGFFTAFAAFLGPVVLGMVVMFFWKKYFG